MTKHTWWIVLLVCSICVPVKAQHMRVEPAIPVAWQSFIGQQLAQSLTSPSAEIRGQALQLIVPLAQAFGETVDLSPTVTPMVSIYAHDPDESNRVAALVALHALGDEGGMQHVRMGVAAQASPRVQHIALALLMDYYGPGTFAGAEDLAAIAESVLEQYRLARLTPSAIALHH